MEQAWNVSVEHQINEVTAARIAYVGSQSYHQSYVQDDNFSGYTYCTYYNNPTCALPTQTNLTNGTLKAPHLPYAPNFTDILEYDSGATASYHSLQAIVQRHLAHGLQGQSSFTWEKSTDVASAANLSNGEEIANPKNLRWSRGISNANLPFTWVSYLIYNSPELKGQSLLVRELLSGWEMSPIISWQSGSPFNVGPGNDNAAFGELNKGDGCIEACGSDRADRVPGVPLNVRKGGRSHWTQQYYNPAAFTTRHDGTFCTSGRNMIQGPPSFNIDTSLMKNWSILERYKLQFRFELFNATNHPVMANPYAIPGDSGGGPAEINGGNGGFGGTSNTTRIGQAALKLTF